MPMIWPLRSIRWSMGSNLSATESKSSLEISVTLSPFVLLFVGRILSNLHTSSSLQLGLLHGRHKDKALHTTGSNKSNEAPVWVLVQPQLPQFTLLVASLYPLSQARPHLQHRGDGELLDPLEAWEKKEGNGQLRVFVRLRMKGGKS